MKFSGTQLPHVVEPRQGLPVAGAAERRRGDDVRRVGARGRVPALQQPVGEAGRERVAGADLVHDLLAPGRRDRVHLAARGHQRAVLPDAHDGAAHAARRQGVEHAVGVARAEQLLGLPGAAQVPVDVLEHRVHRRRGRLRPVPQRRAVVRVEHDVAPAARARRATSSTSARGPSPSAIVIPVRCTSAAPASASSGTSEGASRLAADPRRW